jgi:hypothetical protein
MVYLKEFGNKEDSWSKGTVRDLYAGSHSWYSMNASDLLNTDAELEEAISNSCLKQSGLIQAWGLGNYSSFRIEEKGYIKQTSYIAQYYKRPYLEIIMKSGLKQITKDYMNGHFELWKPKKDEEAKTDIYSVLNLSKGAFKIARADDLSYDDANVVRQCYKYQSNFDINMWHELVNLHENARINISQFISICERTHTSYKRMMEYLQSCYDNQCIEKSNALSIYGDYYNMAEKVGFNLADKAIKFPNSLKKEHDKATFAYKVVENEVKLKEFKKHSEENKKYEFENKKYKVIVPMTPNEVVHEGQVQQHCVASYVNQIERGSTVICFLREKENVDKAFYTCEILNGELYQVKGFCNKYPPKSDEELMNFIQKWTDAKGLVQSYRYH